MKKLICLVGKSGSGKSSLEKHVESMGIPRVVSWTTRQMREGEHNDREYHFVSRERFIEEVDNEKMLEYAAYGSNLYGTHVDSVREGFNVIVVEPTCLPILKEILGENNVIIIYVETDNEIRLQRAANRGGGASIVAGRLEDDQRIFSGVSEQADFVLNNNENFEDTVRELKCFIEKIKCEKA